MNNLYKSLNLVLSIATALCFNAVHAQSNCIVAGVISGGIKGSHIYYKRLNPADVFSNAWSYFHTGISRERGIGSGSVDLHFIYLQKLLDSLEVGGIVSLGYCHGFNLFDTKITIKEPVNIKLGLSIKHHQIIVNAGLKFGYRTLSTKHMDLETYVMTNNWSVGWFHQTMVLIPLQTPDLQLVLLGEIYADLKPAEQKSTHTHVSNGVKNSCTFDGANTQTGFKLGIGLAYCLD